MLSYIIHGFLLDINECSGVDNTCQQQCNNTEGSYLCSCQSGFHLNADGTTCSSKNYCVLSPVAIQVSIKRFLKGNLADV